MQEMIIQLFRSFPPFKGKLRLLRFLAKSKIDNVKDLKVKCKNGMTLKVPNLKENLSFELFANGTYEPHLIDFIVSQLDDKSLFIDVGANIGSLCIPIAKKRPLTKVIAIEASLKIYEYLIQNIKDNNCENLTAINNAVTAVSGEKLKFYSPDALFGKGSMSPVFTDIYEEVLGKKLDDIVLENVGDLKQFSTVFIKVDVEGFEKFVFEGAQEILSRVPFPKIVFEFCDWAEEATSIIPVGASQVLLRNEGFNLFKLSEYGQLTKLNDVLKNGFENIYALKE